MTSKLAKAAAEVNAPKEKSQEKESGQQQQQQSGGVKTPPEQPEFIKQAMIIVEKKVRNLEKRRVSERNSGHHVGAGVVNGRFRLPLFSKSSRSTGPCRTRTRL